MDECSLGLLSDENLPEIPDTPTSNESIQLCSPILEEYIELINIIIHKFIIKEN